MNVVSNATENVRNFDQKHFSEISIFDHPGAWSVRGSQKKPRRIEEQLLISKNLY